MKLGYYCADLNINKTSSIGTYRFSVELLKELVKHASKNFKIVIFASRENYKLFKGYNSTNTKVVVLGSIFKGIFRRIYFDQVLINKAAIKENIDILFFPKGILPLIKKKGIRYAAIIHDLIPFYYTLKKDYHLFRRIRFFLIHKLFLNTIYSANFLFTVSNYSKGRILDILKKTKTERKIIVVPEGCNLTKVCSTPKKFNTDTKLVYVIGNKFPHKNLDLALNHVLQYRKAMNLQYHILVTANAEAELKKYKKYNYIHFLGKVNDNELAWIYSNADFCIFLSELEGFGLPLLESYYYNTPLVFSNSTSLKEIGEGIKGGCNPHDRKSVFDAITGILSLKKSEIQNNRRMLLKKYSWKKAAEIIIINLGKTK